MRKLWLLACLIFLTSSFSPAQVSIARAENGWNLANGHIRLQLVRSADSVRLKSLSREGGAEWAVANTSPVAFPDKAQTSYRFSDDAVSDLPKGAKQLTLRFQSPMGGVVSLMLRLYPNSAVVELATKIENHGTKDLPLNSQIDPLSLTLRNPQGGLKPFSSMKGMQGFWPADAKSRDFSDWLVLENGTTGESMLVGGEPGVGILGWQASLQPSASGLAVRAGTILIKSKKSPPPTFDLAPGKTVETPITFLAIAKGDSDDVGNEAFHYLKQYIFQSPLPNSPWVTYCIWLTEKNSEAQLLQELKLAKQVGFDVFYHDATWFKDASIVPGMNDWTKGLGNYEESREKFPHGIESFTAAIHAAGLKTGIWVDPGNVDASLVDSGQIPRDWVAMINGKELETLHPSLTPTKQLCLGDPKVVAWIEQQLGDIIEKWHLDWVKWDPSATVNYECTRTDHGHGATDGAYAAYRGRVEILRYLLNRFPNLAGFECDPSLQYARTNPGPQSLLPGGYINEFITGPMLSPNVWGSLATAGKGDAHGEYLTARWYSASALDYYFRKHFTHGVTFGNINGMSSQLLSAAPPGFIEAFQRNLLFFKEYRHLLLEDLYHPKVSAAGWTSIQYIKPDASESVVYVFRDKSDVADAVVSLRGLDATANYRVTSLNDRPGRDRVISGASLTKGVSEHLPNEWLAKGDGFETSEFADQQRYGSDILLLQRVP